jgi:hypothetical protein
VQRFVHVILESLGVIAFTVSIANCFAPASVPTVLRVERFTDGNRPAHGMRIQSRAMPSIVRASARIFSALRRARAALLLAWDKPCARLSIAAVPSDLPA